MIYLLSDSNTWSIISAIGTAIAAVATVLYVIFTYKILKQTSLAASSSAEAANAAAKATENNAISIELTAYLALKKDLTTDLFFDVVKYCRLNKLKIVESIEGNKGHEFNEDNFNITTDCLIQNVLNNIEDLALFYEKKVLTLESIDAGYGYSILYIGNNAVIRDSILRYQENDIGPYNGFINLYDSIYDNLSDEQEKKTFSRFSAKQS